MRIPKSVVGAALAVLTFAATATTTQLGTGPGSYVFSANNDSSWFVSLDAGTYDVASAVSEVGDIELGTVWFSTSKDDKPNGSNDLGNFMQVGAVFAGALTPVTFTAPTNLYVNIDTMFGKGSTGVFDGQLSIAAVPEPAAMALLLAGLGLVGLMGLRRRKEQ